MKILKALLNLPFFDIYIYIKAVILLPAIQLCIFSFSLSFLVKLFKLEQSSKPISLHLAEEQKQTIKLVSKIVYKVSQTTRFPRPRCLAQGLAALVILRQHNIPTILFLGVHKQYDKLRAHAWLRCDSFNITGCETFEEFSEIAAFTSAPSKQCIDLENMHA